MRGEITRLLHAGDPDQSDDLDRADELYRHVRAGLRQIAHGRLGREERDPFLQTTLLADDAFLEILGSKRLRLENRRHLFAVATRLMDRALRLRARTRNRRKRNGGAVPLSLHDQDHDTLTTASDRAGPLEAAAAREMRAAIDESLNRLAEHYGATTRDTVVLRRGCGLSVAETANLLGVSERTVKRHTRYGLAWLVRELQSRGYEIGDTPT